VATRSLGAAAEETTIAQYRTLVVLASRGPQRMVDLAAALEVASSTAGRMCDRLVRKDLIRRHRARAGRRAVLVSITPAGRVVVDQATARRRELIMEILARMPAALQHEAAEALRAFAAAAGEVPGEQWPAPVTALSPPAGVTSAGQVRTRGNQLVAVARLASAISWALIVFRSFSGAVASSRPVIPVAERASSPAR
jgi:DNA-binding MarR family transcriptional regulator